jgi:hypothetical protein
MDDVGLHLAKEAGALGGRALGRGLVHAMPRLLTALSVIGTVAMLWVGGGIILHGLAGVGVHGPEHWVVGIEQSVSAVAGAAGGVFGWLTFVGISAGLALVLGAAIAFVLHKVLKLGATPAAVD